MGRQTLVSFLTPHLLSNLKLDLPAVAFQNIKTSHSGVMIPLWFALCPYIKACGSRPSTGNVEIQYLTTLPPTQGLRTWGKTNKKNKHDKTQSPYFPKHEKNPFYHKNHWLNSTGSATTCNNGIPYEAWLKFRQLGFWPSSSLMSLGRLWEMNPDLWNPATQI